MSRGIILKNRFIHIFCFTTIVLVRIHGSPELFPGKKREIPGKNSKKSQE